MIRRRRLNSGLPESLSAHDILLHDQEQQFIKIILSIFIIVERTVDRKQQKKQEPKQRKPTKSKFGGNIRSNVRVINRAKIDRQPHCPLVIKQQSLLPCRPQISIFFPSCFIFEKYKFTGV
jgi:hypothetical protein